MDPGPILIILQSPVYFSRTVYFTRILLLFSTRYTHNLCFKQTGEIDNLIASWEQSICLCVCRFHKYLQSPPSFLSWSINLGFITEGKLAAALIIPSSWGSQRAGHSPRTRTDCRHIYYRHQHFFWRRCRGRKRRLLRGEFFTHTFFTLFYCFALLYLFYLHRFILKTQKKLESLVFAISLLLVYYV